tara:strand:- start:123 stop:392 length:270 start_codon:yes stop_codon:yes gene_type:complete
MYRDPTVVFKKVTFNSSDYLYIKEDDPNQEEEENITSWAYVELKNFYMKKQGKVLMLGNHLGLIYTLTGYRESMTNEWYNTIKSTIDFP